MQALLFHQEHLHSLHDVSLLYVIAPPQTVPIFCLNIVSAPHDEPGAQVMFRELQVGHTSRSIGRPACLGIRLVWSQHRHPRLWIAMMQKASLSILHRRHSLPTQTVHIKRFYALDSIAHAILLCLCSQPSRGLRNKKAWSSPPAMRAVCAQNSSDSPEELT